MAEIRRTITNLEPGQRYVLRTRAINPYGVPSEWSDALEYNVPVDAVEPDSPTDLILDFTGKDLIAYWTPPSRNADSSYLYNLAGYDIYLYNSTDTSSYVQYFTAANQFTYTYSLNLIDFTTPVDNFTVVVKAVTFSGVQSSPLEGMVSNGSPTTPTAAPDVETGLAVMSLSMSNYGYIPDLYTFIIERSTNYGSWTEIGRTSTGVYIDTDVTYDTPYAYRFIVEDVFGNQSSNSPETDYTTITAPDATQAIDVVFDAAGNIASTTVQDAIEELDSEKAAAVHTHTASQVTDFSEAVDDRVNALLVEGDGINLTYNDGANTLTVEVDATADEISYDGAATPGLAATNVEDAIDEVYDLILDHTADTDDAHDASAISYAGSATVGLSGTNVEAVLDELHSLVVFITDAAATRAYVDSGLLVKRVVVDGGGSAPATGALKAYITIPFNCTLQKWRIMADVAGSIVFDLWADDFAAFPPTDADSICGAGTKPTLSSQQSAESINFTSYTTTSFAEGDVLEVEIESASTLTKAYLDLFLRRTS